MTGAIRCGDCQHFRRDKGLYWILLVPVMNVLLGASIIRNAYRYGRCVRKKSPAQMDPAFANQGTTASVEREYTCGPHALFFVRRLSFFHKAVRFFRHLSHTAVTVRDWWRGYSDDDLRSIYEKVVHAPYGVSESTDAEDRALDSCPDYPRPEYLPMAPGVRTVEEHWAS